MADERFTDIAEQAIEETEEIDCSPAERRAGIKAMLALLREHLSDLREELTD